MTKKLSLLPMLVLSTFCLIAQELPEIIPPSPTVANLMQFEEEPVHYTAVMQYLSAPIYPIFKCLTY